MVALAAERVTLSVGITTGELRRRREEEEGVDTKSYEEKK